MGSVAGISKVATAVTQRHPTPSRVMAGYGATPARPVAMTGLSTLRLQDLPVQVMQVVTRHLASWADLLHLLSVDSMRLNQWQLLQRATRVYSKQGIGLFRKWQADMLDVGEEALFEATTVIVLRRVSFHRLLRVGDLTGVHALMENGNLRDKLNRNTDWGRVPLFFAVRGGHPGCVQALIDGKADPNLGDVHFHPLHECCEYGYDACARILVEAGADVNKHTRPEWYMECTTALLVASMHGHDACITTLLQHGASVDVMDSLGRSAVLLAAQGGHAASFATLVDAGASIDTLDNTGKTALMLASRAGCVEIVDTLLACRADANAVDCEGWTSVMFAARQTSTCIIDLLFGARADIDARDNWERTALIHASKACCVENVCALLKCGADVNKMDSEGWTSVMHAIEAGNEACVLSLLRTYPVLNSYDTCSWWPMALACNGGHSAITRHLLEARADADCRCRSNLMLAAEQGHTECVHALLEYGASVNHVDEIYGDTAIMVACAKGHGAVVDLLLQHRAELETMNKDGDTALTCALAYGHVNITKTLVRAGARTDAQTHAWILERSGGAS